MSHTSKLPTGPLRKSGKIRALVRVCIGGIAVAGMCALVVAYNVAYSIRLFYFGATDGRLGTLDLALALFFVYLLLVAASGRWRILPPRNTSV